MGVASMIIWQSSCVTSYSHWLPSKSTISVSKWLYIFCFYNIINRVAVMVAMLKRSIFVRANKLKRNGIMCFCLELKCHRILFSITSFIVVFILFWTIGHIQSIVVQKRIRTCFWVAKSHNEFYQFLSSFSIIC